MKILFLGNSITLHSSAPQIGWFGEWGMAASKKENDYVHLVEKGLIERGKCPEIRFRNIAEFERDPGLNIQSYFAEDLRFAPDVLILRIAENTPEEAVEQFGDACIQLVSAFLSVCPCKVFIVGTFWKFPRREELLSEAADKTNTVYLSLSHLQSEEYQARGLFEHQGVAGHPSDKGMRAIADVILSGMEKEGLFDGAHIADLPEGEAKFTDYTVSVDGKKVPLYQARVSTIPVNRPRPGYQMNEKDLQDLLDQCGEVHFPSGTFLITKPLIIHDDTNLYLNADTILRVADRANCSILDNDGLYTNRTNRNIKVQGGIFDGNNLHQQRKPIPNEGRPGDTNESVPCVKDLYVSNIYLVLVMRFVHVENLTLRDITFVNPTTYALHIADGKYFHIENIRFDYNLSKLNMDGIHIQGPARFGRISNVWGNCNDDHIALCANGTTRSEITRGCIEDIDIDGVYCSNGYTGIRLLSCGDPVRNISIRNIHGEFRFYAVSFTHHYPVREDRPILLENIHISDAYIAKSRKNEVTQHEDAVMSSPLFYFASDTNIRNVLIENVYRHELCSRTNAPTIRIEKNCKVENLVTRNINQDFIGNYIEPIIDENK